jgi:hypothetical protein
MISRVARYSLIRVDISRDVITTPPFYDDEPFYCAIERQRTLRPGPRCADVGQFSRAAAFLPLCYILESYFIKRGQVR